MALPLLTRRLRIRELSAADAPALHAVYGDPEVMRHVGEGPAADLNATEAMIASYVERHARTGLSFWGIEERATGALIGDAGLWQTPGEVELGYTLGRAWWGRGYATEAARACVEHAFGALALSELVALAEPDNEASLRVLAKLGFARVGVREAYGRPHVAHRLAHG